MSTIEVNKITPVSGGTTTTLGDSGDTFTVTAGATFNASSATLSIPSTVITGQTEKSSLVDADKFLISDSAASGALKYVQKSNLGAAGLVKISNYDVSSTVSDITFDNVISSTYKNYLLIVSNVQMSSTGMTRFRFRVGGATQTGSYASSMTGYRSNNGASDYGSSGNDYHFVHGATNSIQDKGVSFMMWINDPRNSATKRMSTIGAYENASNYHTNFNAMGVWANSSTSVDGFILTRDAGSFYGYGQVTIYGVPN